MRDEVPCEVCGKPTRYQGTKRCDRCYEVELRLESYLKCKKGRENAESLLGTGRYAKVKVYILRYCAQVRAGWCEKTVGVFDSEEAAYERITLICSSHDRRKEFWDTFSWPCPEDINTYNFHVESFTLDRCFPLLDDWVGNVPDAWDYEKVLRDNQVTVNYDDKIVDNEGYIQQAPPDIRGWSFLWKHGCIFIGQTSNVIALKAAALFVSLWLRGVSASFCDKLMDGYIIFLERQEGTSLTFLAELDCNEGERSFFRLTREGFCQRNLIAMSTTGRLEKKIIAALDAKPDEEIIVSFTKRKK